MTSNRNADLFATDSTPFTPTPVQSRPDAECELSALIHIAEELLDSAITMSDDIPADLRDIADLQLCCVLFAEDAETSQMEADYLAFASCLNNPIFYDAWLDWATIEWNKCIAQGECFPPTPSAS